MHCALKGEAIHHTRGGKGEEERERERARGGETEGEGLNGR